MSNSNLKKSKTKKKKNISFEPTDNETNETTQKSKDEKKKDFLRKISSKEIIFMNEEEKEGYCVNKYDNGDAYFGYYAKDLRNFHGCYYYSPVSLDEEYQLIRCYSGLWKDDLRHGNGIYLWAKERKNEKFYENFDKSNFKAFAGNFVSDNLSKGTYLSKEGDYYYVYYGTFSEQNKKNGNNCFYFSSNLEQLLYGTFRDNEFVEGYISKFNDDGEIENMYEYKNNITQDIGISQNQKIKNIMSDFRNCIMTEDYFGNIFEVFSRLLKFKDKYLFNIDVINTTKYDDFIDICKSYKKVTINNDIEKYVKIN